MTAGVETQLMATASVRTSVQRLNGGVTVLAVVGDIDMATAPAFAEALSAARALSGAALIVDLTGVEFMGSAGLRVLVEAHQDTSDSTSVAVVAVTTATRRPIEVTGLDDLLNTFSTLHSALAAARRGGSGP